MDALLSDVDALSAALRSAAAPGMAHEAGEVRVLPCFCRVVSRRRHARCSPALRRVVGQLQQRMRAISAQLEAMTAGGDAASRPQARAPVAKMSAEVRTAHAMRPAHSRSASCVMSALRVTVRRPAALA